MLKKLISLLLLSFLLVGITSFPLNTRAVAEGETVYIRADGSIDPLTAPVFSLDNVTYELTDNITTSSINAIVIERSNTVLDGAGFTLTGTNQGGSCGIQLTRISNVTVRNVAIQSFHDGIFEEGCSNCQIVETSLSFNDNGIYYESSDFNTIEGNSIASNRYAGIWLEISKNNNISRNGLANTISSNHISGICLQDCSNNNNIFDNNIVDNTWYGIYIWNSGFNTIFHNNFINNTLQAYCIESFGNSWNDSYPSGGNYWSGYRGVDDRSGPYQSLLGSDGIGDSPYTIDAITSDIDHYPLMITYPWSPLSVNTTPFSVTMDVGQSQLFTSTVSGGTSPFNYQWYLNDVEVPEATSSAWTFVPNCPGSYNVYVNVTDSLSLTAKSDTTTVTVNLSLSVGILPTPTVMDVGQSQLFISSISGGTSPYTYQWYLNGSAVSDATSSWTFTPFSSDSFMIYVNVTDNVGAQAKSNDVTVAVNAAPSVSISLSSANLDVGQSQLFTSTVSGGAFPYLYQWCLDGVPVSEAAGATWTFTPVSSGSYMVCVNVTDVLGAVVTSNTVPVTVNGPLLISIAPGSVVLDMGQSQLFTSAVSGGTSPFNYQWYLNDVAVQGATGSTWTFMPSSPGFLNVYVNVTDSVGFEAESNISVATVNPVLSVGVSPTLVTMDVGQSQLFTSTVSGGTLPFAFQWFLNGTAVSSANSSTWIFAPASEGSYTVYANVTDSAGVQVASDIVPVTVLQPIHNVALTNVKTSKIVVNQGCSLDATVTAVNLGDKPETFNVTVYANASLIGTQTVNNISNGTSIMLNFIWSTTGFGLGNYTLSAYAWPVLGETDTANNNFTGGWIIVSLVGDITGPNGWPDGKVDIRDVSLVGKNFGKTVPPGPSNCDITGPIAGVSDGKIDIRDISAVAKHFGEYVP